MPAGSVVMKFGGSCLKDAEGVRKLVSIVAGEKRCAVVVSAVSGVTDSILLTITGRLEERGIESFVGKIAETHLGLLGELCSGKTLAHYSSDVNRLVSTFSRILYGVYYTGELTPRMRSFLMSFGERLSARIVAAALESAGMSPRIFDSDRLPLYTDGSYDSASALLAPTKKSSFRKLNTAIERSQIPVVTGFFGISRDGHVTLLGRNGTDYSASVVAYAMGARKLIIWKDVDGFLTADPTYVRGAKLIAELSYDEAAELSYFGADVLHPKAVDPAKQGNIEVRIMNILNPLSPGSLITSSRKQTLGIVKSVSCLENLAIIRVYVSGGGFQSGTISHMAGFLGRSGVNIISATTSQTCIAFLVVHTDMEAAVDSLMETVGHGTEKIEIEKDAALMCAVGEGLGNTRGIAAKVFTAISEKGVNVGMMSAGASKAAYHFTVGMDMLGEAMNAVHGVFFGD